MSKISMSRRLSIDEGKVLVQKDRWNILKLIVQKNELYAKEIANQLEMSEQKVHYHLSELKNYNFVKQVGTRNVKRGSAKLIRIADESFLLSLRDFNIDKKSDTINNIFKPFFCKDLNFDANIVVGNAQPHGPFNAVARDGFLVGHLCWFLGSNLNCQIKFDNICVDDDIVHTEEIFDRNLISIGGHITNTVTAHFNNIMREKYGVYFQEQSIVTPHAKYNNPNQGILSLFQSPYSYENYILILAGVGVNGTRAVVSAIINDYIDITNKYEGFSFVLEGVINEKNEITKVITKEEWLMPTNF